MAGLRSTGKQAVGPSPTAAVLAGRPTSRGGCWPTRVPCPRSPRLKSFAQLFQSSAVLAEREARPVDVVSRLRLTPTPVPSPAAPKPSAATTIALTTVLASFILYLLAG